MNTWVTTAFFYLAVLVFSFCIQASEQKPEPRQVLVKTEVSKGAEYPLKVKGMLLIECGPEVVWGVLTDYEHLEGVFPRLIESRIVKRDGKEIVVEQRYKGLMFLSKTMVFTNQEIPMQRIDFRRLGGKSGVVGNWKLEPALEGFTLLTIEMSVRPRRFLMWFLEATLKSHVPQGLISIRKKSLNKLNPSSPPAAKDSLGDPEIVYLEEGQ